MGRPGVMMVQANGVLGALDGKAAGVIALVEPAVPEAASASRT